MISILLCILAFVLAMGLWHVSGRAPGRTQGWAAFWRLACLIGFLRVVALWVGLAAYRLPGWTQVPGYFLHLLGLPEIYLVRSARSDPIRWAVMGSGLLAASSLGWAALVIWVVERLRPAAEVPVRQSSIRS